MKEKGGGKVGQELSGNNSNLKMSWLAHKGAPGQKFSIMSPPLVRNDTYLLALPCSIGHWLGTTPRGK